MRRALAIAALPKVWGWAMCVFVSSWSLPVLAVDLEALNHGVVKIESVDPDHPENGRRTGTGFIVRRDSDVVYIVTAHHVVKGDKVPKVTFYAKQVNPVSAEVARNDIASDLSLLLVRGPDKVPESARALGLSLADTGLAGRQGVTIGFPSGLGDWIPSDVRIARQDGSRLVLSGGLDEGNSGGPVVVGENLAGMVTRKVGAGGFAVPATQMRDVLKTWGVEIDVGVVAGTAFKDCDECPEMVVIPAGRFVMGSPSGEGERQGDEGPLHDVVIRAPFALGRAEVSRGDFRKFVAATGYPVVGECAAWTGERGGGSSPRNWESPGFEQGDTHPVVCVSYADALAYVAWLSHRTGKQYRVPSEAEWEYAARGGTVTSRFWGDRLADACDYGNVADRSAKRVFSSWTVHECDDGFAETSPGRKFRANGFGVFDVIGNVWEWTRDCWNASYVGAPEDGSAWQSGDCSRRVVRGGSWDYAPRYARSAARHSVVPSFRDLSLGFRVSRMLN